MNLLSKTWRNFISAPHRVMFLSGVVQGMAAMIWWLLDLSGRYGWMPHVLQWPIPAVWAHAFLMIYAFLPFFMFGFLFTTYPNWMNGDKVLPRYYIPAFMLMAAGSVLFYIGLAVGIAAMIIGVLLLMAGWAIALYALLRIMIRADHSDKRHPIVTSIALIFGWSGMACYLLWLIAGHQWALDYARTAGIWFFLLPIFVTVSHRMVPFFSSKVLENYVVVRPYWALWLILSCIAGHGVLQLSGADRFLWLADLPLSVTALSLSYFWGVQRSFKVRLLAVLHVAFFWLGISALLYTIQSFTLYTSNGSVFVFGLAPLHALTIGYFTSMMLGMVSRVTLGHSGQKLEADAATWMLFWGFQLVAILRILPEIFPALAGFSATLFMLASLLWLASLFAWAIKYAPSYWRPREDGKPG